MFVFIRVSIISPTLYKIFFMLGECVADDEIKCSAEGQVIWIIDSVENCKPGAPGRTLVSQSRKITNIHQLK